MLPRLATLALISSWLTCGVGFAQDRSLVEQLPKGMPVERVLQIAQAALASTGWRISGGQMTTIDAEDRNSKIRLSVADGAIRYRDLAQGGREPWAKGLYESMQQQQRLDPIPAQRIADLRAQIIAALSGSPVASASTQAAAAPGQDLVENVPPDLSKEQVLRAAWTALAGHQWIVKPGSGDVLLAEITSGDTDAKLKVFMVGRRLRYTDEGSKSRSSGVAISVPERWIGYLRADTARALSQIQMAESGKAGNAPPASGSAPASARTTAERLRALKELHDSGVITRDEYDKKRAEILKDL